MQKQQQQNRTYTHTLKIQKSHTLTAHRWFHEMQHMQNAVNALLPSYILQYVFCTSNDRLTPQMIFRTSATVCIQLHARIETMVPLKTLSKHSHVYEYESRQKEQTLQTIIFYHHRCDRYARGERQTIKCTCTHTKSAENDVRVHARRTQHTLPERRQRIDECTINENAQCVPKTKKKEVFVVIACSSRQCYLIYYMIGKSFESKISNTYVNSIYFIIKSISTWVYVCVCVRCMMCVHVAVPHTIQLQPYDWTRTSHRTQKSLFVWWNVL